MRKKRQRMTMILAGHEQKPASAENAAEARDRRWAERASIATRYHSQLVASGALRPVLPADCPTLQEMQANRRDPLPLVLRWATARYQGQALPPRLLILKDFREDYGPVRYVNGETMRIVRERLATRAQKKGGRPTHRPSNTWQTAK